MTTSVEMMRLEAQVMVLSDYPSDTEGCHDVAQLICYDVIPEYLQDMKTQEFNTATFYLTKEIPEEFEVSEEEREGPGFVIGLRNFPMDMFFYTASLMKADLVVRLMERDPIDGVSIVAVWHPARGLAAFGLQDGEDEYIKLPVKIVRHLLPKSISDEDKYSEELV